MPTGLVRFLREGMESTLPAGTDGQVLTQDSTTAQGLKWDSGGGGGGRLPELRLTLTTATPVTTADVSNASTIYYTPYIGNSIALYYGGSWATRTTSEISLALSSLTSGKNYDIFAYWTGSAVALELSAAWSSDTARTDSLTRQDGTWCKNADTTRRWIGILRTTSTTQTQDKVTQRFLYNAYNKVWKYLYAESASTFSTTSTSFVKDTNITDLEFLSNGEELSFWELCGHGDISNTLGNVYISIGSSTTQTCGYYRKSSSTAAYPYESIVEATFTSAGYALRNAIVKTDNASYTATHKGTSSVTTAFNLDVKSLTGLVQV